MSTSAALVRPVVAPGPPKLRVVPVVPVIPPAGPCERVGYRWPTPVAVPGPATIPGPNESVGRSQGKIPAVLVGGALSFLRPESKPIFEISKEDFLE